MRQRCNNCSYNALVPAGVTASQYEQGDTERILLVTGIDSSRV